ncbi:hypothetical protein Tco_0734210 [Tanacetum coccineum]
MPFSFVRQLKEEMSGIAEILRDQMYVLFQRAVWEEEDCRRVLPSQISEVNKRLSKLEAYIVDIKVLGLRLLAVEPLGYMI